MLYILLALLDFKSYDSSIIFAETIIPKPLLEQAGCANETHLGCADGACVPAEYFCDGSSDCNDSSDEVTVQPTGPNVAAHLAFQSLHTPFQPGLKPGQMTPLSRCTDRTDIQHVRVANFGYSSNKCLLLQVTDTTKMSISSHIISHHRN